MTSARENIGENLRATLLSLKQISDRLKLLNTNSVTKSEALAYKNEIIEALGSIDFTEIIEALSSIDKKIGVAPVGSDKSTIFAWLTTIYEYLAGQTSEEIPEGLGDRINLLLQFFGLPQALPEYQSMTVTEVTDYLEEIMQNIDPDLTAEKAAEITLYLSQIVNN